MTIREMLPEDAAAAAALERKIFPDAWSEKGIAEELRDDFYRGFIVSAATDDLSRDDKAGRVDPDDVPGDHGTDIIAAGYVLIRTVAGEGEILRIGVLPGFRRRGFLLFRAPRLSCEHCFCRLSLQTQYLCGLGRMDDFQIQVRTSLFQSLQDQSHPEE